MLCGLEEPCDFDRMLCTPATSSSDLTAPPAITPVPSAAGRSNTLPAPALPTIGW